MRFLLKSDSRVSIAWETMEKIEHFLVSKNCDIFHINDDIIIKVYKVPLWIGHVSLFKIEVLWNHFFSPTE